MKSMADHLHMTSHALPEIFDCHVCECGESPIWHPVRQQLYWVDITTHDVLTHKNGETQKIPFNRFVTALAWIDDDHLLAATETGLVKLHLDSFEQTPLCSLEADNDQTRSNDGRADPWGGFWISTMDKSATPNGGKIYRYFEGQLTVIVDAITIPNAICFSPTKNWAYFADTATKKFYKLALNPDTGIPTSSPELFIDFAKTGHAIDGAIVDQNGHIFFGIWDGFAIVKYDSAGQFIEKYPTGATRPTCPAFGGKDFNNIYVTTAAINLHETLKAIPQQGKTLSFLGIAHGQAEPQFKL